MSVKLYEIILSIFHDLMIQFVYSYMYYVTSGVVANRVISTVHSHHVTLPILQEDSPQPEVGHQEKDLQEEVGHLEKDHQEEVGHRNEGH